MSSTLDDLVVPQEANAPVLSAAESYERFAVPALFAPAATYLLAAARPSTGERILDVGTGTGIAARLAAPAVQPHGMVTGLDLSPEMLAVARAKSAEEGYAIAWQEGQAEALPFADGAFDLVLSQFALMFFVDRTAALREMRRVLAPGGRVALSVFQEIVRHPFYIALDRAIVRHLGVPAVAAIFALGDVETLRAGIAQAGFRTVAVEPFSFTAHLGPADAFLAGEIELDTAAIPAMQSLDPAARRALIDAISADMAEPLAAVAADGEVVMEFHALIARAQA